MTNSHAWNQFIDLAMGPKTQATTIAAAITRQVIDGAQVCIGVVMSSNHLTRVAEHGPASLQVKGNLTGIKAKLPQIGVGKAHDRAHEGSEESMAMKLPDTIEITGPSAPRIRVTGGLSPQAMDHLQLGSQIKGIRLKLNLCQSDREKRANRKGTGMRRWQQHLAR